MKSSTNKYDAVIIGSGPNGLAAAIHMARNGKKVKVFEAYESIGGGTRTLELTEPGFLHDICSAVHPTALSSPFMRSLPLEEYGVEWVHPEYPLAHPLENGEAVVISQSMEEAVDELKEDGKAYKKLLQPFVNKWLNLTNDLLAPFNPFPKNPLSMARFGRYGLQSSVQLANSLFKNERTKTFFHGLAAHSIIPLTKPGTAAFGLVLGTSLHAVGWPFAKGGSHAITKAMAKYLESLGGEIEVNRKIEDLGDLPEHETVFFNCSPKVMMQILGDKLPQSYQDKLNKYRYGPGVFKIDYALDKPAPWTNEKVRKAGTLHIGANTQEFIESEQDAWDGKINNKPFLLVSQQTMADPSRAPEGKHTFWVYSHCPNGNTVDMTDIIEDQIERFAPGFRECVISKRVHNTSDMENYNSNYVGGDISVGAATVDQLFTRPTARLSPYTTPLKGVYLCSSATPPGGGVHGMCGYHAAKKALSTDF